MASHIVPIMDHPSPASMARTQAVDQSGNLSMPESPPNPTPTRGPSVRLSVPLDARPTATPPRKLLRRDSLERREALLKGKEGSRQRRRWENDRLLSNPHAEPPLPIDWEIRPTYPVRRVPYYLAPLWDAAEFQRAVESHSKGRRNTRSSKKRRTLSTPGISPFEEDAISISREVRGRLKHARSAKGLLQDLEEEVRGFLVKWNERERRLREEGLSDMPVYDLPVRSKPTGPEIKKQKREESSAIETDTEAEEEEEEEEEEIVFVGRGGNVMSDSPSRKQREEEENLLSEKLVCEGLEEDKGAAFGRWLAHCIGRYYGLRTWSVTTDADVAGDAAAGMGKAAADGGSKRVRQAYVGVDARVRGWMGQAYEAQRVFELPRPLWASV